MKTIYYTASSLDGYIADANNSLDWLMQFGEPDDSLDDFIGGIGAMAMGSTTYEWLLEHHIYRDRENPLPWPYQQPTWVFSTRTLDTIPGANIQFVHGDVRPVHRDMAEAAGAKNIWIMGGGDLAGQFSDHGLLDELVVTIAPVTLRGGAPLFPRVMSDPPLRLISVRQFGDAFAELHYQVNRVASTRTS